MYYNNLNRQEEDDDLKFIPLNIREPFLDKDSRWFPIIDMALPTFSELPNSFLLGFETPVDNSNLEGNSLKTIDLIQNNNVNIQNMGNNQSAKEFTKDFNLEYPSETLSEELYSYNKDMKCKKINGSNTNNMQGQNMNNNSGNMSGSNNMNMGSTNMQGYKNNYGNTQGNYTNEMNNSNMQGLNGYNYNNNQGGQGQQGNNISTSSKNKKRDNQEEPIHMKLLRNFSFEGFLDDAYRGESSTLMEEIDRILNIVKSDNSIVETFKAYNVPKPISDLIIKKIIKMTLENSRSK